MKFGTIIAVDPGKTGGITILEGRKSPKVFKMPVKSIVVNKKKKNVYDMKEIVNILRDFRDKGVLYLQEKVGVKPGEGSVSAFTFGKSSGLTIGVAEALDFEVVEVSSMSWKKMFPELVNDCILEKKAEIKELRVESKTLKDKEVKKQNKKQIDKLNRQIKAEAKKLARELVSKKYPKLADKFKRVNTDGMAESLLIALYGKENQNELV